MGLVHAHIILSNPRDASMRPMAVRALVGTGAFMLCLPQQVAIQLGLEELEQREVTLADGKKLKVPFVGPVEIRFENRRTFVGAMVLGDEVLMGCIPMEDLDVIISPKDQTIVVNPQSPNIPATIVK